MKKKRKRKKHTRIESERDEITTGEAHFAVEDDNDNVVVKVDVKTELVFFCQLRIVHQHIIVQLNHHSNHHHYHNWIEFHLFQLRLLSFSVVMVEEEKNIFSLKKYAQEEMEN
jgi:hypothetical protein